MHDATSHAVGAVVKLDSYQWPRSVRSGLLEYRTNEKGKIDIAVPTLSIKGGLVALGAYVRVSFTESGAGVGAGATMRHAVNVGVQLVLKASLGARAVGSTESDILLPHSPITFSYAVAGAGQQAARLRMHLGKLQRDIDRVTLERDAMAADAAVYLAKLKAIEDEEAAEAAANAAEEAAAKRRADEAAAADAAARAKESYLEAATFAAKSLPQPGAVQSEGAKARPSALLKTCTDVPPLRLCATVAATNSGVISWYTRGARIVATFSRAPCSLSRPCGPSAMPASSASRPAAAAASKCASAAGRRRLSQALRPSEKPARMRISCVSLPGSSASAASSAATTPGTRSASISSCEMAAASACSASITTERTERSRGAPGGRALPGGKISCSSALLSSRCSLSAKLRDTAAAYCA